MVNAKEYLEQAYRLDQRIDCKIEQVSSLNNLAMKCNSTISDMPGSATRNIHKMEDIIAKIVDLQAEINGDIDALVDLKSEMREVINKVEDVDYRTVLELRYLCFKPWEQIAISMNMGVNNLFKIHKKALAVVEVPLFDPLDFGED